MARDKSPKRFDRQGESARIPRHAERPEGWLGEMARVWRQAAPFMGAAWALTGGLLAGMALGWWLDRKFDTAPAWLISGMVLGLVLGMAEVARVALRHSRRDDDGEEP